MHLNIPPKGETTVQYWIRSFRWVLLGILIPELVVLSAWRQWLSARQMGRELEKIWESGSQDKIGRRRYEWTIAHSYYASMGGFVFDRDSLPKGSGALFEAPERLTLTASGVLLLAKCGHLPDIDKESIWDKSKADGLAKALVVIQAAWMIVQIIGRLIVRQPITLLEVNTLGHIFCAFVIYILWWKKPKEVHAPTVLEGPWAGPLAAYMYMSSRISGRKPEGVFKLKAFFKPELSELAWYPGMDTYTVRPKRGQDTKSGVLERKAPESQAYTGQGHGEFRPRPRNAVTALPSTVIHPVITKDGFKDQTRQARYSACLEAIAMFPAIRERFSPTNDRSPWLKPEILHLATDVAPNWPSDFYLPGILGELMGMALWLSSSMYGGIHIAAWSDFFPTSVERLLWRFSATYIASSGAFWLLLCVVAFRWPWASQYWDRFIELRAHKIEYIVLGFGATICGIAYIFARVFLVVDAVVSLRQLPISAYDTPDWTTVFPHL